LCLNSDFIVLGTLRNLHGHGVDEINVHEYSATLHVNEVLDGHADEDGIEVWLKYYSRKVNPTLPFKENQLLYIFVQHSRSRQQENIIVHFENPDPQNEAMILRTLEKAASMWEPKDGPLRSRLQVQRTAKFHESEMPRFILWIKNCSDSAVSLIGPARGKYNNLIQVPVELKAPNVTFEAAFREADSPDHRKSVVISPWSQVQLFGETYAYQTLGSYSVKAQFTFQDGSVPKKVSSNTVEFRIVKD